jgi:hypothetical protein
VSGPSEPARLRIGAALILLCVIASVYALAIAVSGGFTIRAGGFRFSTHDTLRPIVIAIAFGASAVLWLRADASRIRSRVADSLVHRCGLVIAVAAAAAIGAACFVFGVHIAFGADASGYLSQARLWRAGNLHVSTPAALDAETRNGQYAFTPLGYQPSPTRGVVVPGYPPGLPLHFAAVSAVAGERAQFAIPPLSAAGIVIIAFLLARRVGGNEMAIIAVAACASSPILLLQSVQPMSDATAAFWWSLAVLLLTYESITAAAVGGVAAGIACGVRPNLFVMVPLIAILAAWWHSTPSRIDRAPGTPAGGVRPLRRWFAFLAGPTAAALGIGWLHSVLYGSVTTSGYGAISSLFSLDHVWPNLTRYSQWAIHTQSMLIAVPIAAPFVVRRAAAGSSRLGDRRVVTLAWSALVFTAALQSFFLLYLVLDDWLSVRFLLPALPWLLVMQAAVFAAICRLLPRPLQSIATLVIALLIASWGIDRARGLGVFHLHESERRYLEVAAFAQTLPAGTVFLTLHHSGSLPYYTSAAIVRWDWLEPDEIDRVVSQLRASRHQVFVVIDDVEERQFTQRFAGTRTLAQLTAPVFSGGSRTGITSRVYALTE